jgi:hypothetical protein
MGSSWEENIVVPGWRSLPGVFKLMETAVSVVPAWEYFSLMSLLTLSWLYHVLDFHLMADLLTGLRGDAIRLFYNPESKLPDQILRQCRILKERCAHCTPQLRIVIPVTRSFSNCYRKGWDQRLLSELLFLRFTVW